MTQKLTKATTIRKEFNKQSKSDIRNIQGKQKQLCAAVGDCECRPLGFLIGLPFAFLALLISLVGVIVWIVGLVLTCICPCCLCVTILVELALGLIKAPILVIKWFTSKIPC